MSYKHPSAALEIKKLTLQIIVLIFQNCNRNITVSIQIITESFHAKNLLQKNGVKMA